MIVFIVVAYNDIVDGDNQRSATLPPHATDPSLSQAFTARMKSIPVSAHLNHTVASIRCYELRCICKKINRVISIT